MLYLLLLALLSKRNHLTNLLFSTSKSFEESIYPWATTREGRFFKEGPNRQDQCANKHYTRQRQQYKAQREGTINLISLRLSRMQKIQQSHSSSLTVKIWSWQNTKKTCKYENQSILESLSKSNLHICQNKDVFTC